MIKLLEIITNFISEENQKWLNIDKMLESLKIKNTTGLPENLIEELDKIFPISIY